MDPFAGGILKRGLQWAKNGRVRWPANTAVEISTESLKSESIHLGADAVLVDADAAGRAPRLRPVFYLMTGPARHAPARMDFLVGGNGYRANGSLRCHA